MSFPLTPSTAVLAGLSDRCFQSCFYWVVSTHASGHTTAHKWCVVADVNISTVIYVAVASDVQWSVHRQSCWTYCMPQSIFIKSVTLVFSSAASKLNYFVEHTSLVLVSAPGRYINSAIQITLILLFFGPLVAILEGGKN